MSLCLCTGLRGELYHGACCDNKTMKLAQLPISSYPYALYVYCTFPRSVCTAEPPTPHRLPLRLRPPRSLPRRHTPSTRSRRSSSPRAPGQRADIIGRTSPRPIHDITPAHVARAHRASDPRVRSTLGDPHRMCMRPGSVLQHKHGSGRAHGRSRCVLSLCCHARLSQDAQRPTGTTHTAYDMHMERRIERRRRHTYNKVLQRATHLRPTSHVVWSDPRATLPFVA